ncbi:MAG: DUF3104 domain-containing protein [Synechococcus sp.]
MSSSTAPKPNPVFLNVRPWNFVIVQNAAPVAQQQESTDWWMGQVVCCAGGARDPMVNSLFQIADVDSGEIRWVNADQVSHVLHALDGINAMDCMDCDDTTQNDELEP